MDIDPVEFHVTVERSPKMLCPPSPFPAATHSSADGAVVRGRERPFRTRPSGSMTPSADCASTPPGPSCQNIQPTDHRGRDLSHITGDKVPMFRIHLLARGVILQSSAGVLMFRIE